MLKLSVFCFGLYFVFGLMPELVVARGKVVFQEGNKSIPEIKIVSAVLGQGRGSVKCTDEIAKVILDTQRVSEISPAGLGLTVAGGKSPDALRIWYRLDGKVVYRPDGKESLLFLKAGTKVNIRDAIIRHAKRLLGENFEHLGKPESSDIENSKTENVLDSNSSASLATGDSEENPKADNPPQDLNEIVRPEFANKPKNFEKSLATVQGLMIQETGAGHQFGLAVDVIVQVSDRDHNQADFHRNDKISKEMKISMEEAIRAVRSRYPKWEERSIRFSFGDKYSEMSGGSAGATFALLTISLLEGFEIDPDFAVTGDILVNWKVKGVGAIPEKIRGGFNDKKKIVAIPTENAEAVNDLMVKYPLETLWQIQIFSTPDLQTLIALARTDRSAELTEAIALFSSLLGPLQSGGEEVLAQQSIREKLERVVELAPNHESAIRLLMASNGKRPTHLSRGESLRELSVLMKPFGEILWNVNQDKLKSMSTFPIQDMREEVDEFIKICHEDVMPAAKQFDRYLDSAKRLVNSPNNSAFNAFDKNRLQLIEQFRKISVNREIMESLLRN